MLGVQMNKKNIRVRKGQAPEKLSRDDFVRDFLTSSRIRPLAPRLVRSSASKSSRGTALHSIAKHRGRIQLATVTPILRTICRTNGALLAKRSAQPSSSRKILPRRPEFW